MVQSAEQDPEARIRDCKNLKWEPEKLAQVHVVRRLLKAQAAAVVEVHCKLCWESLAQHLQARFKMWNKIYIYMPIDNLNQRLRWCQFFGFQWQNLSEILSLFFWAILGNFWPILGHLGPFRVTFWPSWVILGLDVALGHSRRVFFFFFCRKCCIYALFLSRIS